METPPTPRSDESRDGLGAVGALAEPSRRALYDYVVARRSWVSREQAAAAVGLRRGVAAHHLDRLAEDGLLDIEFRRLNDRRGPGAGRPAKLYRRAASEIAVSLPPRDYELAGRVLAEAAERSQRDGTPIDVAIDRAARHEGSIIGAGTKRGVDGRANAARQRDHLLAELDARGFEPETLATGGVVLHNCPFHQLAQSHTELVCGMNLSLFDGLLDEAGNTGWRARLEPTPGACCVRLDPT